MTLSAPALADGGLERAEKRLAQHAHRDVDRSAVRPGLRLAVRGEVLQRGGDAPLVGEGRVALEAAHRRHAQPRNQVRILAEGLFDAPPARLARHVDDRRERLVRTASTGFGRRHRVQALDQVRIERRRQSDRLRKAGAFLRRVSVQALLMEHHRDTQARRLDEEPLDGVGQLGHLPRRQALAGIARPADLSQPVAGGETRAGLCPVEAPSPVDQRVRFLAPDAEHLRDFLLERHAGQQVIDARVDRRRRILVGRLAHRLVLRTSATASSAGLGRPWRSHSSG